MGLDREGGYLELRSCGAFTNIVTIADSIWAWRLVSGEDLFPGVYHEDGTYRTAGHLALMIAVLGPPYDELIRRQTNSYHGWPPAVLNEKGQECTDANSYFGGPFFNAYSGEFLHHDILLPARSLESMVEGGDDADMCIDFLRRMLGWDAHRRWSAKQLLITWFDSCREEP